MVAVDVGESQPGARVRALFADDGAHPGRPDVRPQQACDVRDPRALPDPAVSVIGRRPRVCRQFQDRFLDALGDGHADGVVQPLRLRGQPLEELVRAAAGVCADQDLPQQTARQLGEREPAASM